VLPAETLEAAKHEVTTKGKGVMEYVTEKRLALKRSGFAPVPLVGKAPRIKGWQNMVDVTDEEIVSWERKHPRSRNTGLLTARTPAFDIDILNHDAAVAVQRLANQRFGERGLVLQRIGRPPKRALLFRTPAPFEKVTVNLVAPDGSAGQKLEFLGAGQQLAALGIHPDTHTPFKWSGPPDAEAVRPGEVSCADLAWITGEEARLLVDDAVTVLIEQHGYRRTEKAAAKPPAEKPAAKKEGKGQSVANGHDRDSERLGGTGDKRVKYADMVGNIITGTDYHDSIRDLAASLLGSSTPPGVAQKLLQALMQQAPTHDARWRARYDDIGRAVSSAIASFDEEESHGRMACISLTAPLKPRPWLMLDRIPGRNVTLFSGEGGIGKSILCMMLAAAVVLGKEWLGKTPERGPVLYLSCEDDGDELRRRVEDVARHYGTTRPELEKAGLHVISRAGMDGVLALPEDEKIETTLLFNQLGQQAADIGVKMIVLDTAADVFGGNEVVRVHVRQFINHLRGMAISQEAAVVLVAHPSVSGISSDTGISGSTHWHNGVRARAYFKTVKGNGDAREIEFRKNQYGPLGETIGVRWSGGVFVAESKENMKEAEHERERELELAFLQMLGRYAEQGRIVSDKPSASYAPALFADEPEARSASASRRELADSMRRLFAGKRIAVVMDGPPSRRRSCIKAV
jgi:RecA-family ATPase